MSWRLHEILLVNHNNNFKQHIITKLTSYYLVIRLTTPKSQLKKLNHHALHKNNKKTRMSLSLNSYTTLSKL